MRGSGSGGEILATDIQAHAAAAPVATAAEPAKNPIGIEVPSTLGRLMAERTTQSWTTVPHFFVTREIDASALNEYREKLVAEIEHRTQQNRITHTDLLVALASRVLLKHPRLNSSWTAEGIPHDHVNMGVAIAVNDGVVAAVSPTLTLRTSRRLPLSAATLPNARGPGSCAPLTLLTRHSPSVISYVSGRPIQCHHHSAASGYSRRGQHRRGVVAIKGKPAVVP